MYRIIILIFICQSILIVPLHARGNGGRASFEKAYRIEKKDPESAVIYYRQAISRGLNKELYKAASWRLFYLYRDLGYYDNAMQLASRLGSKAKLKSMTGNIVKGVSKSLHVDRATAHLYIDAVSISRTRTDSDRKLDYKQVKESIRNYPRHVKLVKAIVRASIVSHQESDATRAFQVCHSSICNLSRARLQLSANKPGQARKILYQMARDPDLMSGDKSQILQLIAKSWLEQNKPDLVVYYYRLAANYATADQARIYQALAAFHLYEKGYKHQARALLGNKVVSDNPNLHLLDLILSADLEQNTFAWQELRRLKPELLARKRRGQSVSLVNSALTLLRKGPTR